MNTDKYKIIITPTCSKEINKVYEYINSSLYAEVAAKKLMKKIEDKVQSLKYAPKIHTKIEKCDELERIYRRIVIDNYVMIYTIDEKNMIIYIVHMYYAGSNYLNKI